MITPTLPSPGFTMTRHTEAPSTERCATEHPRGVTTSPRHDERSAIASMKCNVDFLQAVLGGSASALALDALADLATAITRLETRDRSTRVRPAYTLLPPRGHR